MSSESFRSLQRAALRGNAPVHWITESAHEFHHYAKEEHSLPFSNTQYSTWLEKVAPDFLSLCSTRKSQCVLWSVPGERQLNFLREKRLPPPPSWTLEMASVKGEGQGSCPLSFSHLKSLCELLNLAFSLRRKISKVNDFQPLGLLIPLIFC